MLATSDLKNIVEAALLAAGRPLSLDLLQGLFSELECPDKQQLRVALQALEQDYQGRGIEIVEVASGWRIQVGQACSPWVSRLWDERPARYSRALMETLALIAYRQPITRGEVEDIRGVSVSTNIIKTLLEREWVRVLGHRDVPGRPALYGTTRDFLDYFGLKSLDDLPTLAELRDLDEINRELDLENPDQPAAVDEASSDAPVESDDAVETDAQAGVDTDAEADADQVDSGVSDPETPDSVKGGTEQDTVDAVATDLEAESDSGPLPDGVQ